MLYPLVEGYCKMAGGDLDGLAKHLKMTRRTLNNKIHGKTDFTMREVLMTAKYCNRKIEEIFASKEDFFSPSA